MGSEGVVLVVRGGLVESIHRVAWAAVHTSGRVLASSADATDQMILPRSAIKPLQALAAVEEGVLDRFGMGDKELALACASHAGTDDAGEICRSMLHACGLREADLRCGTAKSRDPRVAEPRIGFRSVHHMCSGNHALALAWSMANGASPETYLEPDAPVQQAMRRSVASACRLDPGVIREGVDGCGMRAYEVPLVSLAGAYARLASGELDAAADRTVGAMRGNPTLIGFHGALDTELMLAEDGLVAKLGAEGVLAVGLADGRGLALKVHDGAERAVGPAGILLAREVLGLPLHRASLDELARPPIVAAGHRVAGTIAAQFDGTASFDDGFR